MFAVKNAARITGLALIAILAAGCLVSGTFIIVESFTFTSANGHYFYKVDITDNSDWDKHKDQIDQIDAVGVEFYITSTESGPVEFNAYVDEWGSDSTVLPGNDKKIINGFVVNPGANQHVTYAQSLGIITNLENLKALVKSGKFYYWGTSTGNDGDTFKIDSGKVIVTFSASGS
jgi:hypothetical protein